VPLDPLRAWDAGDEYLLDEIHQRGGVEEGQRVMLLNDDWGTLFTALRLTSPNIDITALHDNALSSTATRANLQQNTLPFDERSSRLLDDLSGWVSLSRDANEAREGWEWVLIKLPRSRSLLEDQLRWLPLLLTPTAQVIVAGMVKYIQPAHRALFEKFIGPTTLSLARKKARLFFVDPRPIERDERPSIIQHLMASQSSYHIEEALSTSLSSSRNLPVSIPPVINLPGVFAEGHLDLGARALLPHIVRVAPRLLADMNLSDDELGLSCAQVIDLGCGDGVLGCILPLLFPAVHVHFMDISHRAIECARRNFAQFNGDGEARSSFTVGDCLDGVSPSSVDLILNNPPFHEQNAVSLGVAYRMFTQSYEALKPNGALIVVANRHLQYHRPLKRLFGRCQTLGETSKFLIMCAKK
jgi:23S rRNA (guanine1835-N2)-methyltransferase